MKRFCFFCILVLCSCNGFLDKEPLTSISPSSFWNTEDDLRLALNGLYNAMNVSYTEDNRSDDTFSSVLNQISSGTNTPPNTDDVWTESYKWIRVTNDFLENYKKADVEEPIKNRYVGEARFFRAYYYYKLVRRFGDVLLIDKMLDMESEELYSKRTDKRTVWNFIIEDLKFAADNIPPKSELKDDVGRITQGAAYAMLARVSLYAGTFYKFHVGEGYEEFLQGAKEAALQVMNSKEYDLFKDYRNLFLMPGEDSNEHILSFRYSEDIGNMNPVPRNIVYDLDCEPTKHLADNFLCIDGLPIEKSKYKVEYLPLGQEFENRDPRMALTLWKPGDLYNGKPFIPSLYNQTKTGYMFKKYGIESAFTYSPEAVYVDNILIRYAEVLLIYAEAIFELNEQISDNDLDMSINLLRDRFTSPYKLPHLTNAFVQQYGLDMRTEIRRERRSELAGESFRYDDIIRWKTAEFELPKSILGIKFDTDAYPDIKPGEDIMLDENGFVLLQSKDSRVFDVNKNYLYPMPLRELSLNPNLGQNPGWE